MARQQVAEEGPPHCSGHRSSPPPSRPTGLPAATSSHQQPPAANQPALLGAGGLLERSGALQWDEDDPWQARESSETSRLMAHLPSLSIKPVVTFSQNN